MLNKCNILGQARRHYEEYANRSRRAVHYEPGDQVLLNTRNLHGSNEHGGRKLKPRAYWSVLCDPPDWWFSC